MHKGNDMSGYFEKRKEELAEQRKRNPENKPTQSSVVIRMVAGGYLLYLVYQMLKEGALSETGGQLVLMIGGILVLGGFGIFFFVDGLKRYLKHDYFNPVSDDFSKTEDESEEETEEESVEEPEEENEKDET